MAEVEIYHADCLEGMNWVDDGTVDLVLSDLPYGNTNCRWDTVIPFEPLWAQYSRVLKPNGALVLMATQPFATDLINSQRRMFRYDLVWEKSMPVGFANSHRQPLRSHENILVFYRRQPTYNPQDLIKLDTPVKIRDSHKTGKGVYRALDKEYVKTHTHYPRSVLRFQLKGKRLHPTQKPLELFEYLVRTYTNPGDLVMDNCMGSGTTAIACINSGRQFVGFEKDEQYFEITKSRIKELMVS